MDLHYDDNKINTNSTFKYMGRLPKDYTEVTISQLIELKAIDDDKSIDTEPAPELTRALLRLSVFNGVPYEELEQMPISDLKSDLKKMDFLNTLPSDKPIEWFKCGGYWWKVNFDITKLTAGNYIDMDMWVKDPEMILSNSHKILSVFCQPFKWLRKYNKLTDEEKYEKLKHCPVSVAYPLSVFFCNLFNSLIESIPDSLLNESKQLMKEAQELRNLNSLKS